MVSTRIKEISNFITKNDKRIVDIGSDHNFLGLFISSQNKIKKYTCIEIAEGPLNSSIMNTQKYGDPAKFDFFLNDGLKDLLLKEKQDVLIISGMGSPNIINIINNIKKGNKIKRFVCQTNNKSWLLREYLINNKYKIIKEKVVIDNGINYEIIEFKKTLLKRNYLNYELYTGLKKHHMNKSNLYNKIKEDYNKIKNIDSSVAKKDLIKRKESLQKAMIKWKIK